MADLLRSGPVAGMRMRQADDQAMRLNDLAAQKEEISIAQAQTTLAQQQQMMEAFKQSNGKPPTADDLASNLERMSGAAALSGMFDKAKDYAAAGSSIRRNDELITKNRLEMDLKKSTAYGTLLQGVRDQATWERANAVYEAQIGEPSPFAQLPYDPGLVTELKLGSVSMKDRATIAATNARKEAALATQRERDARLPLILAQIRATQARAKNLEKVGAAPQAPKAANVSAVADLIMSDYGGSLAPEEARVFARPIAERAAQLMHDTQLPLSEASMRAYKEAEKANQFAGLRKRVPGAGTATKPLAIPSDQSKLRTNMYYQGAGKYAGQTFLWNGQAFLPVGEDEPDQIVQDEEDEESDEELDEELDEEE